jgi:NTE family protein
LSCTTPSFGDNDISPPITRRGIVVRHARARPARPAHIDGGTRSFTNADLAVGHARVVIMLPVPPNPVHETRLANELAVLTAATPTVKTLLLQVDADAIAAIGSNPLDPAPRGPALEAGRRQGRALLDTVGALW